VTTAGVVATGTEADVVVMTAGAVVAEEDKNKCADVIISKCANYCSTIFKELNKRAVVEI